MANVFVSYARDDRARIQPLVSALEAEGLSVWWDPALIPGRRFRQMIAHELSTADSVLVIWTRQALESDWVQDEAEEARKRGVLIPIIMEPVTPPAGFRQLQAADLSQWTGQAAHPEFKALIHACKSLVQWAEQERATAHPTAKSTPAETVALVANPNPAPIEPQAEVTAPKPVRTAKRQQTSSPETATGPASSDIPLPVPPPQPEGLRSPQPPFGEQLVRAVASPTLGWGVGTALLVSILGVCFANNEPKAALMMSPLALVGPASMAMSGVILRRGLKPAASLCATLGAAAGLLVLAILLVSDPPNHMKPVQYFSVLVAAIFLALAGHTLGGLVGILLNPQAGTPTRDATSGMTLSPHDSVPPPTPTFETQATGFVPSLLRTLAGLRSSWLPAAVASVAGTTFFFSVNRPIAAVVFAIVTFIVPPAGAIAQSMLVRGLPKAPVVTGLIGMVFGLGYGLRNALAEIPRIWRMVGSGLSIFDGGLFSQLVLAISVLIFAPLLGFVILGAVANLIVSLARKAAS